MKTRVGICWEKISQSQAFTAFAKANLDAPQKLTLGKPNQIGLAIFVVIITPNTVAVL
jgi:hypothetical protein